AQRGMGEGRWTEGGDGVRLLRVDMGVAQRPLDDVGHGALVPAHRRRVGAAGMDADDRLQPGIAQCARGDIHDAIPLNRTASAADLKFLHHWPHARLGTSNRQAALGHRLASAPLLPKFLSEDALMCHELRKRGTSLRHLILPICYRRVKPAQVVNRSLPLRTKRCGNARFVPWRRGSSMSSPLSLSLTDWLLILVLATMWGGSYVLAAIALAEIPPLTI